MQLRKKGCDCLALRSGHLSLDNTYYMYDAPLPCPLAPTLKPREQIVNFVQGASPPPHTPHTILPPPLPSQCTHLGISKREEYLSKENKGASGELV